MHEDDHLTPAEMELERALGRLRPAAAGLDRDRLMFRAGQAAGRRGRRTWQAAAAGLAAALMLTVALSLWRAGERTEPSPSPDRPVIAQQTPAPVGPGANDALATPGLPSSTDLPGIAYLRLRDAVLDEGLDALPTAASAGQATPARQMTIPGA